MNGAAAFAVERMEGFVSIKWLNGNKSLERRVLLPYCLFALGGRMLIWGVMADALGR